MEGFTHPGLFENPLEARVNLDNIEKFQEFDTENYLEQIFSLPGQLEQAWREGLQNKLVLPTKPSQILICGMGGSAIGGELISAFSRYTSSVPILVWREYDLPMWAKNDETLVVASSYSGNTEETLSVFSQAIQAGCMRLAITRGGKLGDLARQACSPVWLINHVGQPRAAVATSFGLLVGLLKRLELINLTDQDIHRTTQLLIDLRSTLIPESPIHQNPAKRLAGQLFGRMVCIIGSDLMSPVATRWVGQINELAKAWAQALSMPEMNHNSLSGSSNPFDELAHLAVVFLQADCVHPRNRKRLELTRELFMVEGINTDFFHAPGETELEQIWSAIQFGDFVAYYLAMLYEMDPTPIPVIEQLKQALKD